VRHSLYTVSLLTLFSLGVVAANWFILAYCALGLVVFRFLVIPAEEEQLLVSFGDEYREYQRRTGALVPRLFK
jgi:protein-S-isoprenylcysteine O-methyltransferase Ste14